MRSSLNIIVSVDILSHPRVVKSLSLKLNLRKLIGGTPHNFVPKLRRGNFFGRHKVPVGATSQTPGKTHF